jgi:sulfide:quinone oxidoreductase
MNAQKIIIILGGGMGGLVVANKLKEKAGSNARIVLIDKSKTHIYAPSFLYLMLGKRRPDKIQRPLALLKRKGIEFINEEIIKIDLESKLIKTQNQNLQYEYLVISLGAELAPEKIPGLAESGCNLYELKGVEKLRDDLKNFEGGKAIIVIASLPFKCPAAPYEAAFLLDEYFQKKGIRDKTEISIFTPEILPLPATGLEIGRAVAGMLAERKIGFNPETNLISVDPQKGELRFSAQGGSASGGENGDTANSLTTRTTGFDLLIFIPPHQGPKVVRDSGLGNEAGWITVDKKTLKIRAPEQSSVRDFAPHDKVFAIGDVIAATVASGKPRPKAGVFAHYEAEVVAENIARELKGLPADREYDGHASCFLEVGYGKAGFASGNFYAEPAPIVKMKQPGRLWRLGKILFEKYWLWKWF